MPVAIFTAERLFSAMRRLKTSLGLMHIHRDFEVDLYKATDVFVSAKTRRVDFWQF